MAWLEQSQLDRIEQKLDAILNALGVPYVTIRITQNSSTGECPPPDPDQPYRWGDPASKGTIYGI